MRGAGRRSAGGPSHAQAAEANRLREHRPVEGRRRRRESEDERENERVRQQNAFEDEAAFSPLPLS